MKPRIAIPEPTTLDRGDSGRSLQPYLDAVESAGGSPLVIAALERQESIARVLRSAQGVLLPGSRYDVDPQKYGEEPIPKCARPDAGRSAADELLLQDAFNLHKPVLAICYGIQALNVWCNGSLYQDLATQLATPPSGRVNHQPGRAVERAHKVRIAKESRLSSISPSGDLDVWVNSSHHQAIRNVGDNLRVNAVSPEDGVIEGVELDSTQHFVLGVQWHPERTYSASALSRALFAELMRSAAGWEPRRIDESVARA